MDKTIEVLMIVVVASMAAGILAFMLAGESSDFMDWASGERSSSQCTLTESRYTSSLQCTNGGVTSDLTEEQLEELEEDLDDCENDIQDLRNNYIDNNCS